MRVMVLCVIKCRLHPCDILPEVDSCGRGSASWIESTSLRIQCDGVPSVGGGSGSVRTHFSWRVLQVPNHSDSDEEGGVSDGFVAILHDSVFDRGWCDHDVWNRAVVVDSHRDAVEVGLSVVS